MAGTAVGRWLTKFRSMSAFLEFLNILSNQPASPPPPSSSQNQIVNIQPAASSSSSVSPPTHPITEITRELELGKLVINVAVPVTVALLLNSNAGGNPDKLPVVHGVAVGIMIGCMSIWNGILFRNTDFSSLANILEQFGIGLVLFLLYGLAGSFLPRGFSWLIWVSGGLCLLPFIYARIKTNVPTAAAQVPTMTMDDPEI